MVCYSVGYLLVHWYKRDVASAFVMVSQGLQNVSWAVGLEERQWVICFDVLLWVVGWAPCQLCL
jgi:hypothetical protein